MTYFGGGYSGADCFRGCGTVFRVTSSGKESVIYSFKGGYDGANPSGSLASLNGFLWGTTSDGGSKFGTVFKMSTSGHETIVHRFEDVPDGAGPTGLLAVFGNTIYGTTRSGGTRAGGTLFSATSKESALFTILAPAIKVPTGWYSTTRPRHYMAKRRLGASTKPERSFNIDRNPADLTFIATVGA